MAFFHSKWTLTALFVGGLTGCLFLAPGNEILSLPLLLGIWFVVCLAAESLWHPSSDDATPVTVSPAAHLPAVAVLPVAWSIPLISLAAVVGALVWRRASPRTSVLCILCTGLAGGGAFLVLEITGVHRHGGGDLIGQLQAPLNLLYFFAAGVVYTVVYQTLNSFGISRARGVGVWSQWRSVYGHETELIASGALILVATIGYFCYETLGFRGLLLCAMPLLFVRDGSRRNIELKKAQSQLIKNERLAAKGEMAAEIGHELNNYLAAISGRAQLLVRGLSGDRDDGLRAEAEGVREMAHRMGELAKGLMEFSRKESRRTSSGLNDLVRKTVDFVRPQAKYRVWEFAIHPDPEVPRVEIDPGQIQQVLLVLLGRLTDGEAPNATARCGLEIRTYRDESTKDAGIEIRSSRPSGGTDGEAEDQDLITVRRILDRHRGRLLRDEDPEGESYRVLLPAA